MEHFEHSIADLSKYWLSIKTSSLKAIPLWLNLSEPLPPSFPDRVPVFSSPTVPQQKD